MSKKARAKLLVATWVDEARMAGGLVTLQIGRSHKPPVRIIMSPHVALHISKVIAKRLREADVLPFAAAE